MASFSRSFKPPSYLSSVGRRPGMPGRSLSNLSNTSDVDSAASSPGEINTEDIIYSAKPSPTYEGSPLSTKKANDYFLKPLDDTFTPSPESTTDSSFALDTPRSIRSRPIAIEFPVPKRPNPTNSQAVYTPPAPLSARGDLPGGYFPNHEDQNRVYRSHPFHLDVSEARQTSIRRASRSNSTDTQGPSATATSTAAEPSAQSPATAPLPLPQLKLPTAMPRRDTGSSAPPDAVKPSKTAGRANTPVSGYIVSGAHANPSPMGKYYPSNYESRKSQKRQDHPGARPSSASSMVGGVKSDSQVPTARGDVSVGQPRNESEAKRRLQQYQRDMIAQATFALSGGRVNTAALNAISLRNIGFSSMSTKPNKPRLEPLGSPGPVTPIDLADGGDGGYLGVRVPHSDEGAQVDEIARAMRAEDDRRRREGATSPAVELSPSF